MDKETIATNVEVLVRELGCIKDQDSAYCANIVICTLTTSIKYAIEGNVQDIHLLAETVAKFTDQRLTQIALNKQIASVQATTLLRRL